MMSLDVTGRAAGLLVAATAAFGFIGSTGGKPTMAMTDPASRLETTEKESAKEKPVVPVTPDLARQAVEAAKAASKNAYCPYSKFPVGAAVVTEDGTIHSGCNVENASYGLTLCAERNSVFQAVAKGRRVISLVVVYTPTQKATAPCGACRQVINEFGPHAAVLCVCDSDDRIEENLDALLKKAFGPKNLE